jgi:pyruvate carboxylase
MPGGQYTNLREQARAMGLEHRWTEVSQAYADVNMLFGDIVKVTPTSKVVGDMALFMVANDLTPTDVLNPDKEIAFPESVISLFKGELGFPPDGFPPELQKKILKGAAPLVGRPGEHLPAVDLVLARSQLEAEIERKVSDEDLASYLMYPKVYKDFVAHNKHYGDVSVLPTPVFFYGLQDREEISLEIDQGKSLIIRLQGQAQLEEEGDIKLFFELNGQPRLIRIPKAGAVKAVIAVKAQDGNPDHVGAPMPGMIVTVAVKPGQSVSKGDALISIEAMKMETMIRAERDGIVKAIHVKTGKTVSAKDLLLEYQIT